MPNPLFRPLPAFCLHANGKTLDLSSPQIMGILNVTPDSFSDGGQFNTPDTALAHVDTMIKDGATIIDIGAESTRPNACAVCPQEEIARLYPIVKNLRQHFPQIWLSIDTSSPDVMAAMADLGADIWNDVRALSRPNAPMMAAKLGLPVVLMHSRGEPNTMNDLAHYDDTVAQVMDELKQRINLALSFGVKKHNIILDVGMGFAKKESHHNALMHNLGAFTKMGYPMLFGVSKKRYLGEILHKFGKDNSPNDRDFIGIGANLLAVQQGCSIIRTHNVAASFEALTLWRHLLTCNRQ